MKNRRVLESAVFTVLNLGLSALCVYLVLTSIWGSIEIDAMTKTGEGMVLTDWLKLLVAIAIFVGLIFLNAARIARLRRKANQA